MPHRWLGSYVTTSYDPLSSSTELLVLDERFDGSSVNKAATSAVAIKLMTGTVTNGQYWINVPTIGPTLTYCIMDPAYDGGGWMMAMKATRGTTFNYTSAYWTTTNTLNNSTGNNQNDGDAKFDVMNYFPAKDMLARWPDIGAGGSIGGLGSWIWLQNNYCFLYGNTSRMTLINFFGSVNGYQFSTGKAYSGWGSGAFSSQSGIGWYGYNFTANATAKVRWGFGWNNEADFTSDDVSGGIGMNWSNYSAGDLISCCQDTTGINRTARVEVYIR